MNDPLRITITAPDGRSLPDGSSITFSPEYDGVWLRHWGADHELLAHTDFSYEEWETFRQQRPDLNLPQYEKPRTPGTNENGNTVGRVTGEVGSSSTSASDANPPVSTGTKILDGTQVALDVVGLIPVVGEAADLVNAGISAMRGDWVGAGLSLASMIPFLGWGGTVAKVGRRGADVAGDAAGTAARRTDNVPNNSSSGGSNGRDGGRVAGNGNARCILRPYKPDTCKPLGMTGHHVVADRAFRLGSRTGPGRRQIPGAISEADGLVICVQGATPTRSNEHGRIHNIYNEAERLIGLSSIPPGTASLLELELAGAAAVSRVTGCNAAALAAQLRTYHQAKGMGGDFIVSADPSGRLPTNPATFGPPDEGDF